MKQCGYSFQYSVRRTGHVKWALLSQIFADAAAWLEGHPEYDADCAVAKATDHLPDRAALIARLAFRENFGARSGDDEGVLMLCFASVLASTGDL